MTLSHSFSCLHRRLLIAALLTPCLSPAAVFHSFLCGLEPLISKKTLDRASVVLKWSQLSAILGDPIPCIEIKLGTKECSIQSLFWDQCLNAPTHLSTSCFGARDSERRGFKATVHRTENWWVILWAVILKLNISDFRGALHGKIISKRN